MNAYIPENILYVCKANQKIQSKFDEEEKSFFNTRAHPAFPVDPIREKTIKTARDWAKSYYHNPQKVAKEHQVSNDPIKLQLVGLDIRSQGGRAWKVIVEGEFYVDLREDILLEAILSCGVEKNGFINGEFIWTRMGSHMKLVRVGSALHDTVKKSYSKKDQKKVSIKDLVPGTVYVNVNGETIFLGFVNSATINIVNRYYSRDPGTKNKPSKMQLWISHWKNNDGDIIQCIKENKYCLNLVKSKTVYPTTGVPLVKLHDNLIESLRQLNRDKKFDDYYNHENFGLGVMAEYPNPIILDGKHAAWWNSHKQK